MTVLQTLLTIAAAQGVILALLLMFKASGNHHANRILSVIIGALSISILSHALSHAGLLSLLHGHRVIITTALAFISPLIVFYVRSLTDQETLLFLRNWLWFTPFFLCVLLDALGMVVRDNEKFYHGLTGANALVSFSILALALFKSHMALRRYSRLLRENFSDFRRINLQWLRVFIVSLNLVWLGGVLLDLFFREVSWDWIWLGASIIIYLIGHYGFAHPQLFSSPLIDPLPDRREGRKYQKSSLSEDIALHYQQRLETAMQKERLFLDKEIGLADLADHLGMSGHHLSQIINERFGQSFYDFVNGMRIDEAKRLLRDEAQISQSIASIAFATGFNSLSAFNAAFKRMTGKTPSQFRLQD